MMEDLPPQSAAPPYPPPRPPTPAQSSPPPTQLSPEEMNEEELLAHVAALQTALIPCLPYSELASFENSELRKYSLNVYRKVDVEMFVTHFMEAAQRLQLYFIAHQREDKPTKEQLLQKEIAIMEEELEEKNDLIQKHSQLIHTWKEELKELLDRQIDYMAFV